MFIEMKIASEVLAKYEDKTLTLIADTDNFLKIILEEYNAIIETVRSQSMIVNPELLRETQRAIDIEDVRKKVTEEILLQLYIKKQISKGVYEALCQTNKQ